MLLGFYERFCLPIEKGTKIQTMRNEPKRMPKIGETLYMYSGGYHQKRKLISKEHKLVSIQKIEIIFFFIEGSHKPCIYIDGILLENPFEFYINDGFNNEEDFINYWKLKKPQDYQFIGRLFHWTHLKY